MDIISWLENPPDPYLVGATLKRLRVTADRSREEQGRRIGRKPVTVGAYERGELLPPLEILVRYAEDFDVPLVEIVGYGGPARAKPVKGVSFCRR